MAAAVFPLRRASVGRPDGPRSVRWHYEERAAAIFTANLRRYIAGEPLLNLVRKAQRY